jgi:hypothetical protein
VFWMWGIRWLEDRRSSSGQATVVLRWIFRGADLARFRLIAIKILLLLLDIDVQCSGVEMMDLRQCRHTWVSGIIGVASKTQYSGTFRTM